MWIIVTTIRKLTDYFLTIIDKKTLKKNKKSLLRFKNSKLTRIYGPVYIDFYDYSTYTDAIYDIFGTQFNANIIFCQ